MDRFRSVAPNRQELDKAAVEAATAAARAHFRANFIGLMLRYDIDGDGRITREEVMGTLSAQTPGRADRTPREVMRLDTDGDGTVDSAELRTASEQSAERALAGRTSDGERFLTLAGTDGTVRAIDVSRAAERAFDIVDLDRDGLISPLEVDAFRDAAKPTAPGPADPIAIPPPPRRGGDEEIHLAGIYEGFTASGGATHGPRALVAVDRPGKRVTLLLCSHRPVTWSVTLTPGTELREVRMFGHARTSAVLVDDAPHEAARLTPLEDGDEGCPQQPVGDKFRVLIASLAERTGFPRLSNIAGRYRAPSTALVLNQVSAAPEFAPRYLEVAAAETLPDLRFGAVLRGEAGLYDLTGRRIAEGVWGDGVGTVDVPGRRERFTLRDDGLERVSGPNLAGTRIPLSLDVPAFSWPTGIAYDSRRERVVVVSLGGAGFLYEYRPSVDRWGLIASMRNRDVRGLLYEPVSDCLWGIESRSVPGVLVGLAPSGEVVREVRLDVRRMPGLTDLYDPGNNGPDVRLAYVDERRAVLVARGKRAHRLYLVDLATGAVTLTAAAG